MEHQYEQIRLANSFPDPRQRISRVQGAEFADLLDREEGNAMYWDWILPVAFLAGFVLLWVFVLPHGGG